MANWLLKSEPSDFSYDELECDGTTVWDRISNALAPSHLRLMSRGDSAPFYRSGKERAAVGTARIASDPCPDPRMIDPAKAVVGIALDQRFPSPVPLSRLKAERVFHGSPLLRLPRLSLLPVMAAQWKLVNALSQ